MNIYDLYTCKGLFASSCDSGEGTSLPFLSKLFGRSRAQVKQLPVTADTAVLTVAPTQLRTAPVAIPSPAPPRSSPKRGSMAQRRTRSEEAVKTTGAQSVLQAGARALASFETFTGRGFSVDQDHITAANSLLDIAANHEEGLKVVYGEHPDGTILFGAAHTAVHDNGAPPEHGTMVRSVGMAWKINGQDSATKKLGAGVMLASMSMDKLGMFGGLRLKAVRNAVGAITGLEVAASEGFKNNGTVETQRHAAEFYVNVLKAAGVSAALAAKQAAGPLDPGQFVVDAINKRG